MQSFHVAELRIGIIGEVAHAGGTVRTAIAKRRVPGPLELGPLGFQGDTVADTKHHGGSEKAVCAYAAARYPLWERDLGVPLKRPAFGENLLLDGVVEEDVRVGDVVAIGTAVLAVSQPRVPCYVPAAYTGQKRLTVDLRRTGWTGWYLRVVEPGQVAEGDAASVVERVAGAWSVAELNAVRYAAVPDREALRAAAASPALNASWREALERLAEGGRDDE
jgi:MOSC domain-containing protein YiiM